MQQEKRVEMRKREVQAFLDLRGYPHPLIAYGTFGKGERGYGGFACFNMFCMEDNSYMKNRRIEERRKEGVSSGNEGGRGLRIQAIAGLCRHRLARHEEKGAVYEVWLQYNRQGDRRQVIKFERRRIVVKRLFGGLCVDAAAKRIMEAKMVIAESLLQRFCNYRVVLEDSIGGSQLLVSQHSD